MNDKEKVNTSTPTERELWKMLNEINLIMWESYMIKDASFGRPEADKIMAVLEKWANKY